MNSERERQQQIEARSPKAELYALAFEELLKERNALAARLAGLQEERDKALDGWQQEMELRHDEAIEAERRLAELLEAARRVTEADNPSVATDPVAHRELIDALDDLKEVVAARILL